MILKDLELRLDDIFKNSISLDWDNTGLIIGRTDKDIKKIYLCLDADLPSIKAASENGCDLLLSHHPPYLDCFKKIVSDDPKSLFIIEAIQKDIAVYCAHTNFDIMNGGLNEYVFELTGAKFLKYITPLYRKWYKFITYAPLEYEDRIRETMNLCGCGKLGNYSCCTFKTDGKGTFIPEKNSKPFIGKEEEISIIDEIKIECIVSQDNLGILLSEILKSHPYEQPAYDIFELQNKFKDSGIGIIGKLDNKKSLKDFLNIIKKNFNLKNLRYLFDDKCISENILIEKIAVLNGSANSSVNDMASEDFDVLVCGEISYHNLIMLVQKGKAVIETGHLESEIFSVKIMTKILKDFSSKNSLELELFSDNKNTLPWRYLID